MENIDFITYDAIVIGTGAAGYNAAIRIAQDGRKTVAIVTEGVNMGTSRNTGSDKQTYYKLGLGGAAQDSARQMAADLFSGGATDGDTALCEAVLSARCFLNLCELGVPFPANRYGEYVGYKTDHDPYARATSAGPLTSQFMTEALEKKAKELNIPVYDGLYAIQILKNGSGVCGLLCLQEATGTFRVFRTPHVVLATGGPAGIYADSVYPECHTGSSSLALLADAEFQNMTYWQYGLASVQPRWNVSGTYMQVLPRFVSVDAEGTEREFLTNFFADPYDTMSAIFLKGYQWPFDIRKVLNGSSVIDLLVYRERVILGRRVYLDYKTNPFHLDRIDFDRLSNEAKSYLEKAGACFGTPIQRLLHMNQPAYELFLSKGVDLKTHMLEIALCAQHCNGGISVDLWWQTTVPGLFAAGECAGTHGVARPGGSALNAGQVGSLRAAQYISQSNRCLTPESEFTLIASQALRENQQFTNPAAKGDHVDERINATRKRMSACGGAIRNTDTMVSALAEVRRELLQLDSVRLEEPQDRRKLYQYRDALTCQLAVLSAMIDYDHKVGKSVGSSLCYHEAGSLRAGLPEEFRFTEGAAPNAIQQGKLTGDSCAFSWRPVRPIPADDDVFETVWRGYRENKNVF